MSFYKVDKYILQRLLQGYKIPKLTQISVDEVYARSPKQQKKVRQASAHLLFQEVGVSYTHWKKKQIN